MQLGFSTAITPGTIFIFQSGTKIEQLISKQIQIHCAHHLYTVLYTCSNHLLSAFELTLVHFLLLAITL